VRVWLLAAWLTSGCGAAVAEDAPVCPGGLADAASETSVDTSVIATDSARDADAVDASFVDASRVVLLPPSDPPEPPKPAACGPVPDPGGACGEGKCVPASPALVTHVAPLVLTLRDGRVFVLGGDGAAARVAEIYDPTCDRWKRVSDAPFGYSFGHSELLQGPGGALLPDGRVIVASRKNEGTLVSAAVETYDPATDTWSDVTTVSGGGADELHVFADGRVLLTYGDRLRVSDPTRTTWSALTVPWTTSLRARAVVLADDRVLVGVQVFVSEEGGGYHVETHVYLSDRTLATFRELAGAPVQPWLVKQLADGRVVFFGTFASGVYDLATERWTTIPDTFNDFGTVTELPCKKLLSLGNYDSSAPVDHRYSVDLGDLTVHAWTNTNRRYYQGAALLRDGRVLLVGGVGTVGNLLTPEICR
jgi:hypothetical protein